MARALAERAARRCRGVLLASAPGLISPGGAAQRCPPACRAPRVPLAGVRAAGDAPRATQYPRMRTRSPIFHAALMTYSALGYPLTASVAFPALALFNLLRFPVMMFPQQVGSVLALSVCVAAWRVPRQAGCVLALRWQC